MQHADLFETHGPLQVCAPGALFHIGGRTQLFALGQLQALFQVGCTPCNGGRKGETGGGLQDNVLAIWPLGLALRELRIERLQVEGRAAQCILLLYT